MRYIPLIAALLLSLAQGQYVFVGYNKGVGASTTPTLIQGPFAMQGDSGNSGMVGSGAASSFLQGCFAYTTQANDTIIAEVISQSATSNMAVTDDGSTSNSYAIPSGGSETAGSRTNAFYVATVIHASRCVDVTFTSASTAQDDQMILWEYSNLGVVDKTCAATVTSGTSLACAAMTTTVNGDLILAGANVVSFSTKPTGSMHFTAQASWTLDLNDGLGWLGNQNIIQSSSGSITPTLTSSSAVTRANIVGVAFKPTSTGGSIPSGPYLLSFQGQNNWGYSTAGTSTSETFYFPCPASVTGTVLWLVVGNIDTTTVSAVSDSNSNTWTGLTRVDSTGDGFSIQWYHTGLNPTCSGTENLTLTYGANPSALVPLWNFFIVTGASTGYDSSATCGAGSTPCPINTTCSSTSSCGGATITPSGYPALVLSYQNQDFDTMSAVNVGNFLTAEEICPNATGGCGGNGTGTNYWYQSNNMMQDAGVMADTLASGSAAITWTVANTQSQNVGASFSSTVAVK